MNNAADMHRRSAARAFKTCFLVSIVVSLLLQTSGLLHDLQLRCIDTFFRMRPWVCWSADSLNKIPQLCAYHETHEIPHSIWCWDYTLSWLIEDNHPRPAYKYVIFNRLPEDEPPEAAVDAHEWMRPLLKAPLPEKSLSGILQFLVTSKAKLIIVNSDLGVYGQLAKAVNEIPATANRSSVPILVASGVRDWRSGSILRIEQEEPVFTASAAEGKNMTGAFTCVADDDQVVRTFLAKSLVQPVVIKALDLISDRSSSAAQWVAEKERLPEVVGIDFTAPANSSPYPVRPIWYLLDPDKRRQMLQPESADVTLKDAIVIIGDGIRDLYSTPLGNNRLEMMSRAELIAQSIDTVARGSWLGRLSGKANLLFLLAVSLVVSLALGGTRLSSILWQGAFAGKCWRLALGTRQPSAGHAKGFSPFAETLSELCTYACISLSIFFVGFGVFVLWRAITPVANAIVAVGAGVLAANAAEREALRTHALTSRLGASLKQLQLQELAHKADLQRQRAELEAARLEADKQRRQEYICCLNHDLRAPLSVLNWTLCKLKREGLTSANAPSRLETIERTSERMTELLAALVESQAAPDGSGSSIPVANESCDMLPIISRCVSLEQPIAEMRACRIKVDLPACKLTVRAAPLDLERMVANVLRNAVTHNPAGTEVTVVARRQADEVIVCISDNGKGIAPGLIPKLFDDGFTTLSRIEKNEGLGLVIVKQLAEKYGGSVSVSSMVGEGSTFKIVIPATANNHQTSGAQDCLCQIS